MILRGRIAIKNRDNPLFFSPLSKTRRDENKFSQKNPGKVVVIQALNTLSEL
jgi:hypothetical protein